MESKGSRKMESLMERYNLRKASFIQYRVTQGRVQSYLGKHRISAQGMGRGCLEAVSVSLTLRKTSSRKVFLLMGHCAKTHSV